MYKELYFALLILLVYTTCAFGGVIPHGYHKPVHNWGFHGATMHNFYPGGCCNQPGYMGSYQYFQYNPSWNSYPQGGNSWNNGGGGLNGVNNWSNNLNPGWNNNNLNPGWNNNNNWNPDMNNNWNPGWNNNNGNPGWNNNNWNPGWNNNNNWNPGTNNNLNPEWNNNANTGWTVPEGIPLQSH